MTQRQLQSAVWQRPEFWAEFDALEARHQSLKAAVDGARRAMDQVDHREKELLLKAWRQFRGVAAQLAATAEAMAALEASGSQRSELLDASVSAGAAP